MASWNDFAADALDLAAAGLSLWRRHALMYLATVRTDGSPRLHPVVPVLADGEVYVAVGSWSPKWRDLARDPRCVLHCLPGSKDDEFVMRCRAIETPEAIDAVRATAEHRIHDDDHVFRFDIEQVDHGWWEHVGQPGTYPLRRRWQPDTGVVELPAGGAGTERSP